LKQGAIYRKLAVMALTLPWLLAAVTGALGMAVPPPSSAFVNSVVARVVNETASRLGARRGIRIARPLSVRLIDRSQLEAAVGDAETRSLFPPSRPSGELSRSPPSSSSSSSSWTPRRALLGHLGLLDRPSAADPSADRPVDGEVTDDVVTGLYDLAHHSLLVGNWADLAAGRLALNRDVALAILDQRFDLTRWLADSQPAQASRKGHGQPSSDPLAESVSLDAMLARQALLQGDATVQVLEDLHVRVGFPAGRALAGIAEQIRAQIVAESPEASPLDLQSRLFVELEGMQLVASLRARSPWRAVDEVWRHPPPSSEAVLHPEKLRHDGRPRISRDDVPDELEQRLPAQPLRGDAPWRVVYRDTLGELGMRLFLARTSDPDRSERGASGWGGDRALLFEEVPRANGRSKGRGMESSARSRPARVATPTQARTFVAWLTTWDDETDARDFAEQAATVLAELARTSRVASSGSGWGSRLPPLAAAAASAEASGQASDLARAVETSGRSFTLARRRRMVGMLLAAPGDLDPSATDLLSRLMDAASVPLVRRAHAGKSPRTTYPARRPPARSTTRRR